jgi:hypothetical protein
MRYNDEDYGDGIVSFMVRDQKAGGIYFRVTLEDILVWERFQKFLNPRLRAGEIMLMSDAHCEMMEVVRQLEGGK